MIGKAVKYYAIARAPKLAYSIAEPRKAARIAKTGWDLKHAWAPRITGVAALAVALPLGFALGRLTAGRRRESYVPPDRPLGNE
jgi:hypothetical protein